MSNPRKGSSNSPTPFYTDEEKKRIKGLSEKKLLWYWKLSPLNIPKTIIEEDYQDLLRLSNATLVDLIKKAKNDLLEEIYFEYRFAGKKTISLYYIDAFRTYTKSEFIVQIKNHFIKQLAKEHNIEIPESPILEKEDIVYFSFNNFSESQIVLNRETNMKEERTVPDYPVIVFQENNPFVQVRTSVKSSLRLSEKLLCKYLVKDDDDFSCNFNNDNFKEKILEKFTRATSMGLEKKIQKGTAQKVQLSDPYNVLGTQDYKDQKALGASEKYVYLIEEGERNFAVQINFKDNKLVFRKYTSEKMINEIIDNILGIAHESGLYKHRRALPDFFGKDK